MQRIVVLNPKGGSDDHRLGIIANRVRRNTVTYQALLRFLGTLRIPIVATLRDSQNYVRAAESGLGLQEMKPYDVAEDLAAWQPMLDWLEVPSTRSNPAPAVVQSMCRA
jgi:chromosome partitioning protein